MCPQINCPLLYLRQVGQLIAFASPTYDQGSRGPATPPSYTHKPHLVLEAL
jgi:hypothetical protein